MQLICVSTIRRVTCLFVFNVKAAGGEIGGKNYTIYTIHVHTPVSKSRGDIKDAVP